LGPTLVEPTRRVQDLQGPSYLFAILTDDRIAGNGRVTAVDAG
jgi:hypothetical protein